MSALPVLLPYGFVGVYGLGTPAGSLNPTLATTDIINRFATIYFIGANMYNGLIGQSVIFNEKDEVCQLAWDNYPYPVIPYDKVIATEIILP
jgi:hypothetical protein